MPSPPPRPSLDAVVERAGTLYSLPTAALEVLRLTSEPKVDARALCECLQHDPALTAKLLRVVNSSLYGLSGQVETLAQAVALLGVRPLKLLVLGFSLPTEFGGELWGDALRRYWRETLTRSTAAREIAEIGWGRDGDEAFVAGMMQGIGQLVLLGQLGDEYAGVFDEREPTGRFEPEDRLTRTEREAFGFDHRQLSAALLRSWGLPERFAVAIGRQAAPERLTTLEREDACLAQSLRLANLMTRVVADRELAALPALTEEGKKYSRLSLRQINTIVEKLDEKVGGLADAMAVDLSSGADYQQALLDAHAQLSVVAEGAVGELLAGRQSQDELDEDERVARELLGETRRLSRAMQQFLTGGAPPADEPRPAHAGKARPSRPHGRMTGASDRVRTELKRLAAECRSKRQPLSVTLVEIDGGESPIVALREWLDESGWAAELASATWAPLGRDRFALLWPDRERQDASRLWSRVADGLADAGGPTIDAGVAAVTTVPAGFDEAKLLEAAERCLAAASAVAGPAVKSIEVF